MHEAAPPLPLGLGVSAELGREEGAEPPPALMLPPAPAAAAAPKALRLCCGEGLSSTSMGRLHSALGQMQQLCVSPRRRR